MISNNKFSVHDAVYRRIFFAVYFHPSKNYYRHSLNNMTLDQLQWLSNRSKPTLILWPRYRTWPLRNYKRFSWSICHGCGIPVRDAYPSGHMVPSLFGTFMYPYYYVFPNLPSLRLSLCTLPFSCYRISRSSCTDPLLCSMVRPWMVWTLLPKTWSI